MFGKMNIFSKPILKILLFLGRRYQNGYYVREIAGEVGIGLGSASEGLKNLEKMGFVIKEKRGRLSIHRANLDNPVYREMKVLFTLLEIKEVLENLRPLAGQIILFGSCATGEDTQESDIDLFIEADDKKAVGKRIDSYQVKTQRKISPVIMSPKEFIELREKDKPLYERIKSGRILR